MYPNEPANNMIVIATFIVFLMSIDFLRAHDQRLDIKKQDKDIYMLGIFNLSMICILFFDVYNLSIFSHFIVNIIFINMIGHAHFIKERKYLFTLYANLMVYIFVYSQFGYNQLLDYRLIVLLLVLNFLIHALYRKVEKSLLKHITIHLVPSILLQVGGIFIFIEKPFYYLLIYGLLFLVGIGVTGIVHYINLGYNQTFSHYMDNAIYDSHSSTYSSNYLKKKMEQFDHNHIPYTVVLIDIITQKNKRFNEAKQKTNSDSISTLRKCLYEEIERQDLVGRINDRRFCIVIRSNINIEKIRQTLFKMSSASTKYHLFVIEK